MATECEPTKQRRYDPSMSRRTRKPPPPPTTTTTTTTTIAAAATKSSRDGEEEPKKKSSNGFHRASLKELMKKEGGEEKDGSGNEAESRTDTKPMEAEEETTAAEKRLPMVRKRGEGIEGGRMAGLVSRYAKVLNHLINVKRGSKKKNAVQLF